MSSASNLTPYEVITNLSRIGKEIDKATADMAEADRKVVELRHKFEMDYAKTFLATEGAMEIRKYTAKLATGDSSFALEAAEQELRAVTANLRALRDRLEIGRSISPLVRLEWGQTS